MKKVKNDISEYQFSSNGNSDETAVMEKRKQDRTEKLLFYILLGSLTLQLVMLIYAVNEWLVVKSGTEAFLSTHYNFGQEQPFYYESPENYLRFMLRFIIIYGLVFIFGVTAVVLRRPWLYLLIIVMTLISVIYFFLL